MGNKMFPFITDTVNPIAGGPCPFNCSYCWATALKERHQWKKYRGEYRILEKELRIYPSGSFVFPFDMIDVGDPNISKPIIRTVFSWMQSQKEVNFLLLTKNPKFYRTYREWMQPHIYAGVTIESDIIPLKFSKAPHPHDRADEMNFLRTVSPDIHRFVSIEPIMKFTHNFRNHIVWIKPDFVAIGYDNYNNGLPEPSLEETEELINDISNSGIKVYRKTIRDKVN